MKTLYPVKGCGRCADITAASLLGADVYDVMLDHLNNHQFFPSRYADVERLAIKARRSTKRQKIVIDFNLSENEVEALRVHLHNLVKSGKNGYVEFEYPAYCGIPKAIARKLTGDQVDAIQDAINTDGKYNKNAFSTSNKMKDILLVYGLP